jgi:hypothetical protein
MVYPEGTGPADTLMAYRAKRSSEGLDPELLHIDDFCVQYEDMHRSGDMRVEGNLEAGPRFWNQYIYIYILK